MNREAFALAHETLRDAVVTFGWSRRKFGPFPSGIVQAHYAPPLGKFEGEHWAAIHFYNAALNGGGDEPLYEADGTVAADLFMVEDVERAAFAFKPATAFVALWYSDTGFVSMVELTADEYDEQRTEWELAHAIDEEA